MISGGYPEFLNKSKSYYGKVVTHHCRLHKEVIGEELRAQKVANNIRSDGSFEVESGS